VVLVDKGYCGTSGVTATGGVGHWYVEPTDRPEEIKARSTAGGELTDPEWMRRTMEVAWRRLPELDRFYAWPIRNGRPNRRSSVRGPEYMRLMRGRVRRAGVTILDHHPATRLLAHRDGAVGGATGIRLQEGGSWTCVAPAVILATGGRAFLSRLLGANNNTGDGHLMAAEAGAHFSAMEFSSYYTVAAAHSTMTRSIPFMYGTYRDCDGTELPFETYATGIPMIARALARGPVTVSLEWMPSLARDKLRHVQPNFLLPLVRRGIDPFRDPFPVTLRGEGTIRGTGGIELTAPDCQTGVEGLFAVGDVASRQRIVGAASGGGQPNAAWCVASGTWAGQAAVRRAKAAGQRRPRARPIEGARRPGAVAGTAAGTAAAAGVGAVRATVSRELNDVDKNLFRSGPGLTRSRALLDGLWEHAAGHPDLARHDRDGLRAHEAAALVAVGRWVLSAALARQESRGMHRRTDAPDRDPRYTATVETGGLDAVWTTLTPIRQQEAS
jgi:succinate dehydrogenase/fumarate reductase flavoprotein subunit